MSASQDLRSLADEDLVRSARKLREQDPKASIDEPLGLLYERHFPAVRAWCQRLCGNPEHAEDAAQEVFLRLQTKLHTFRGDSRFSTWLYSLTRRTTINFLQRPRHRAEDRGNDVLERQVDGSTTPASRVANNQLLSLVRQAMDSELEPLPKQVLYLHYFAGLSLSAIDTHLGLTNKSGAKAHLVAGQRALRKALQRQRSELETHRP